MPDLDQTLTTTQIMWTDADPPTYEWGAVNHGLVFRKEGAGQLDWGPTGIGVLKGTTMMATPYFVGIPEGPGVEVRQPAEETLSEKLTYGVGGFNIPQMGPRIDDLDDYYGEDQGYIPEGSIGDVTGSKPQQHTSTSIRWTSGPQDMGVRKMKNVQAIEVETDLTCPLFVGVLARTSPMQPFDKAPTWGVIRHPVQRAGFNLGGIEHIFLLYARGYGVGTIGRIIVYFKLMDMTAVHSNPNILRGAS